MMESNNFQTLLVSHDAGVCTVTMNRPEKFNAMSRTMREELGDCFLALAREESVRVIVLTGSGTAFSGGGDINDFGGNSQEMHALMDRISHRWFRAFWNLPQPVIAAVNGPAAGGGCNLAFACDLIYATEDAYFAQTFIDIGLVPDLGGAFLLPRLMGMAKAKEMAMLGERMPATEAERLGLINAVVPNDKLMEKAQAVARKIAGKSPQAIPLIKKMLNRSCESSMESILDQELAVQSFLFGTDANRQGVSRFLGERRQRSGTND